MSELKPCAPTNDELNEAFDLGYQACLHDNEKLTWDAAEELQQYRRAQHMPTVDAVEVVRCRDCVHFGECLVTENDYCSKGERKEK